MFSIKSIQGGIKHVLFQSYNWKDENMNINNDKTSNRFYIVQLLYQRIFCWGQFLRFRTITSCKIQIYLSCMRILFIHKDIPKNSSLGKRAWKAAACSLELKEQGFWPVKQVSYDLRAYGGLLFPKCTDEIIFVKGTLPN